MVENLSVQELELFYKMNQADMELYQKSKKHFETLEGPAVMRQGFLSWIKQK